MVQTMNARPGAIRPGAQTTLPTDHDAPRWSDRDLRVAYQLGYEARGLGEDALAAIDDAYTAVITPPVLSYAARVAARIAEMEACAETIRERLAEQAGRNRAHDLRMLAAAGVRP